MKSSILSTIRQQIIADPMNSEMRAKGYQPIYTASTKAKIIIIGQAPGIKAQESKKPWNDISGRTLRSWLGVTEEQFYDPDTVALVPMDFYYPGKGKHGDLPPRKGFAQKWHPQILTQMPLVQLTILIGAYSQKHYLGNRRKKNLTETVRAYSDYLPEYFPLVHPSPLNLRWQAKNLWFASEVVPFLRKTVKHIIKK